MPAILIRIFTWLMTSIAGQVMFSLGVGMVSFTALNSILLWIQERIIVYFNGATPNILIAVSLLEIDYYVSVLLSAVIIKATIMSAQVALAKK